VILDAHAGDLQGSSDRGVAVGRGAPGPRSRVALDAGERRERLQSVAVGIVRTVASGVASDDPDRPVLVGQPDVHRRTLPTDLQRATASVRHARGRTRPRDRRRRRRSRRSGSRSGTSFRSTPRGASKTRCSPATPNRPSPRCGTSHLTGRTARCQCGCTGRRQPSTNRRRPPGPSSTSTAAGGPSGRSTRSTVRVASSRPARTQSSSPLTTGSPQSTLSPLRSTRRPRPSRGSRATRRRSAATPTGSASPATSAGGTLALAAALHAREFGEFVEPAGQFLLYPIAGHDFETDSYRENADGPLLTCADMRWFFEQYLRSPADAYNPSQCRFAPTIWVTSRPRRSSPPASIRSETTASPSRRFEREGTPVDHRHYPAMAHGFCSLSDRVAAAEAALSAVADDVRERL